MNQVSSHTNRLFNETSPYLLQHAHNLTDWYPWGEEAFQKAKEENKPILLSIGYSACHWCHVMEHESFNEPITSKYTNKHFIPIKVDREERPDIDKIYMSAVMAMGTSGGWPLNVFLTPDLKPFLGGTYYPPIPYANMPSWMQVLEFVSDSWSKEHLKVIHQAEYIAEFIKSEPLLEKSENSLELNIRSMNGHAKDLIHQIYKKLEPFFDTKNGGFGRAPKFLNTYSLQFLMQYHYYTGDKISLEHVLMSLRKMSMGGLFDHVGGGFARYSTDEHWFAPHFEKMLYDNALMINTLSEAFQLSPNYLFRQTIQKTIRFISSEMTSIEGGFFAALDADSEGKEGKYYTWSFDEIASILKNDTQLFCDFFEISEQGNFEGKNILYNDGNHQEVCNKYKSSVCEVYNRIDQSLEKLYQNRKERVKPRLDDKILLGWNALMCSALIKAYQSLNNEEYKIMANINIDFLLQKLSVSTEKHAFYHQITKGIAANSALLDDYAFLIKALIDVYQVTFDSKYLLKAKGITDYVIESFLDKEAGLFYYSPKEQADLIARKKDIEDNVTASGNSQMVINLQLLHHYFNDQSYSTLAENILQKISVHILDYPLSFSNYALALCNQIYSVHEIVISGADTKSIAESILKKYIPNRVIANGNGETAIPLSLGKPLTSETLIYHCINQTCNEPHRSLEEFYTELTKKSF